MPQLSPKYPLINVRDLCIVRDAKILNGINWQVNHGEHWAVLGANGSGKTSLLNCLAGYMWPSSGTMQVLGKMYGRTDWRELRKSIGLVSSSILQRIQADETPLATVVTGKDAVINAWGPVSRRDQTKAKELLALVECTGILQRPWKYLSQGERQRVLIGRALMARTRLLILDEPCAGLDPAARQTFLDFLQRFMRRPDAPTLVLVTHHVEEILGLFSHVLILKDGSVLAAGPKKKVCTSANLAQAFNARVRLTQRAGVFKLRIHTKGAMIA